MWLMFQILRGHFEAFFHIVIEAFCILRLQVITILFVMNFYSTLFLRIFFSYTLWYSQDFCDLDNEMAKYFTKTYIREFTELSTENSTSDHWKPKHILLAKWSEMFDFQSMTQTCKLIILFKSITWALTIISIHF